MGPRAAKKIKKAISDRKKEVIGTLAYPEAVYLIVTLRVDHN